MRYRTIISEDAAKDIADQIEVDKAIRALTSYLYDDGPMKQMGNGSRYIGLGDIGVKGRLANVFFVVTKGYEHMGSMYPNTPRHGYPQTFTVTMPVTDYDSINKLVTTKTMAVLSHELHHVLDFMRLYVMNNARNDYDANDVLHNIDGREKYYNTPTEYNSYFFGLANRLLSRIRDLEEGGDLDILELYDPLPRDFRKALPIIVGEADRADKAAYSKFNPVMMRHFIKRLYGLFQRFWKTYDEIAKDQQS